MKSILKRSIGSISHLVKELEDLVAVRELIDKLNCEKKLSHGEW